VKAEDIALDRIRQTCLALPETSETVSWGHPNFRAGKRTFVTFEWISGRASIAFRLPDEDIERLRRKKRFFVTPYGRGQWVSTWADGKLDWNLIEGLVERSYRVVALKRMIRALDARQA
jgi:predicted DNA-binding protein (MmcQ/YjbR family)